MSFVRQLVHRRWRAGLLIATGALVALAFATPVIAGIGQEDGAAPAAIIANGGTINQVFSVTEQNAFSTASVPLINLPGATATVNVPNGQTALINARFTAESVCSGGGAAANWCKVVIYLNGVEMNPVVGGDFAFDSTNLGNHSPSSWQSRSVERSRKVTVGGNYTVQVRVGTTNAATTFRLDDWTLTVERIQP